MGSKLFINASNFTRYKFKKKSILDLCAAPGGKAFQVLAEDNNIILNDVSKKRIKILKENLLRLNYNTKINNFNALVFPEKKKYDVVLLDAPCSATGTIRGNPEIFFKKKPPNLISLFELQKNLLEKAANLLNPNGIIVYMVCSFLYSETTGQINNFLKNNKNFSILKYDKQKNNDILESFLSKDGYFLTTPNTYKNYNIDGFFSIQLIKND